MSQESDRLPEDDMLPDERAVLKERAGDLDDLDEEDFLSVGELAAKLGFDRK